MYRLFHASDLHFGAEDHAALDWFASRVHDERPDALIITGDLTMRARRREFAAAAEWLSALNVPLTIEIGNHDMPYFNLFERFTDPYKRYRKMTASIERPINLPGVAIIPLCTTAPAQMRLNWSKGIVRKQALEKAVIQAAATPPGTIKLVAAHHPLRETGTSGTALTHGGNRALEALAQAGVEAVLSGHVHDPFDIIHTTGTQHIRMVGAGTLSERVRTTRPSFNALTIADGTLGVEVVAMD
jgi:3',5'-cyclic AMP phosphodiesterase CpdA